MSAVELAHDHAPELHVPTAVRQGAPSVPGRPPRAILLTTLIAGAAIISYFGALAGAYMTAKPFARPWPPTGYDFNTEIGFALFSTILIASALVEWAAWALRHDARRQAFGALGIAIFMHLAFLNLGWYHLDRLGVQAGVGTYEIIAWTLQISAGAVVLVAGVYGVVTFFKALTGEQGSTDFELARSYAWFSHFASLAVVFVYWLLWYVK